MSEEIKNTEVNNSKKFVDEYNEICKKYGLQIAILPDLKSTEEFIAIPCVKLGIVELPKEKSEEPSEIIK